MNKLGILKAGFDETVGFVTKYINSAVDKNELLDPLSTLCKLALLSFHKEGTKISVDNNRIYFQDPGVTQTVTRWYNNYKREDLHQLMNPVKKLEDMYDVFSEPGFNYIIALAIEGVEKLTQTYEASNKRTGTSVVIHSLEMYKTILLNLYNRTNTQCQTKERRISSVSNTSSESDADNGTDNELPPTKDITEFTTPVFIDPLKKLSIETPEIKKSPSLGPLDDSQSVKDNEIEMSIHNDLVSPIKNDYKEFKSLWTQKEVQILYQLFFNTCLCKNRKRPSEFNLRAIEAFLEGKDDLFKVMVDKLVSEL